MVKSLSLSYPERSGNTRWIVIAMLLSTVLGVLSCIVPVYWIAAGLLGLVLLAYLVLNPDKLYFLTILTIPCTDRMRVLPISFSVNEIFILLTLLTCLGHQITRGQRVNFRTPIDGWILVMTVMYFLAGLFSASETGLLGTFKIFEGFLFYYVTVYLIQTKQASRSMILKVVLWTAVSQALLGIFQSFTGIGSSFQSPRGYLGYLGLGSNVVWHGRGTTWHFNSLGNYLTTNAALFLPLFVFYMRKSNPFPWLYGFILLLGIITTYSRGSLLGLIAAILFFLAVSQSSLKRSLVYILAFLPMVILPCIWLSGQSSYTQTLNYESRLTIWQVPMAAINSSTKAFFLGCGLNSYHVVAWPYIPAWVKQEEYHNWFAHNFYLLTVVEVGVIGAIILFGFLGYIWIDSWRLFRRHHGWRGRYALAVSVAMVATFFVSIFDHAFATPYFKVFIFVMLGLLYGRRNTIHD